MATQQNLASRGHEVTIHPYAQADSQTMDQGLAAAVNWFQGRFGFAPTQTVRNHQLAWQGWADGAKVAQNYGVAHGYELLHLGLVAAEAGRPVGLRRLGHGLRACR